MHSFRSSYGSTLQRILSLSLLPLVVLVLVLTRRPSDYSFADRDPRADILTSRSTQLDALPPGASQSWYSSAMSGLERSEYEIRWQPKVAAYQSPNRKQNLRFTYHADGFTVTPRTGSQTWMQTLRLTDYGRANAHQPFRGITPIAAGNTATVNTEALEIRYTNATAGMRQDFVVKVRLGGSGPLVIRLKTEGDLTAGLQADGRGAGFLTASSQFVYQYSGLTATDAAGRQLEAWMELEGGATLALYVQDDAAEYPILVDPLSSGTEWTAEANQAGANFGNSAASAGDVNGDGYSDIIVGACTFDNGESNEGRAFVFLGSASGLSSTASWTAESNQAYANFGNSVASAGDVNGDGYSDVIVGAYYYDNGEAEEGRAYVYLGSASGLSATASWIAESDQEGAYFGVSVVSAGDVNGDGYSDVIVGAYTFDNGESNEGRAFVYLGSASGLSAAASWTAESNQADANFGNSVASAGDVNGDGYSDVIVGAIYYDNGENAEGRAYVYLGSASGLSAAASWTAEANQASASFGNSVASAGDVNGDGYLDVIVGAAAYDNGETDEGRAFVFLGSASGLSAAASWTAELDQVSANFGCSVASAGDVNGDGYADVIVGANAFDNGEANEGRVYVYLGSASGLSATSSWTAESNQVSANFGCSVASAGDVNGDGFSDIVVGASSFDDGEINEGLAFVYPGSSSGPSETASWTAEVNQAGAYFGYSAASAGDVNADGYSDIIVGAYGFDNGESNEGRAFVYLGSTEGFSATASWSAESNQANASFGFSVASAGDVNGDGYSDVVVGAYAFSNGEALEGRAYVYLGSASGISASASWIAEPNRADVYFGYAVASAGDVNGDSYSDIIVAAPGFSNGETEEGRVFVYLGSASGISATASWTAESNQSSAFFGCSVGSAGDVNGDGFSDVIVGAQNFSSGEMYEGRAFAYYGSSSGLSATAGWTAESNQSSAFFGHSVALAGDVNGDGYSDVIVGAYTFDNGETDEGRASVFLGSASGISATASWTAESNQADANFGYSVAPAGDVNGDGYSDVIVGAICFDNGEADEGRVYVYLGSTSGLSETASWTAESNQTLSSFGRSVASAGDVNGDGYSDVIVGADDYYSGEIGEGRVFVYLGSSMGLSESVNWTSESDQASANFGYSVASAGDVNGDGYSDLIIGAPYYDNGETNEGMAFVYHGSPSGLAGTPNWTAESNQANARFSWSVGTAGDVNGDGYSDVIIGAPYYDNGETDEGRAFVFHGSASGLPSTTSWTAETNQITASFGYSVCTAGDVNGDGYSDVVIGAPFYDNAQSEEGRAYVYHGSASGLNAMVAWTAESNQIMAMFGRSVSTAGDVNGDGFSDVIVGAYRYDNGETDEGRAFLYTGSASGLSAAPSWTAESNQASAYFGNAVASAGDVNGDGYADVVVSAEGYDNGEINEGRTYAFLGSSSGLSATANWIAESNRAGALLGRSVASAGDVNGDGYSDVVFGAPGFDNGEASEGRAYVYHGSVSGLPTVSNWTTESNQVSASLGSSVASAGDVNGDGYCDVVVGSSMYDNGSTDEGAVFVHYGNGGPGVSLSPRQLRTDLTTPVVTGLKTRAPNQVGLGLQGRTFFGRSDVKVQYEVKPLGTPFDGTGLTETASWIDVGTSGAALTQLVSGLTERTLYKWRVRTKYRMSDGAVQPYSRWIYPNANGGLGEADFQVSADDFPLPVEMLSISATTRDKSVLLTWTTATETENFGYEVERRIIGQLVSKESAGASAWEKAGFVNGSGTSSKPVEYSFEDENLPDGRYAYRIKQIDKDGSYRYTEAVEVSVGDVPTVFSLDQNYPNPFNPTTTIRFGLPKPSSVKIVLYDLLGKAVMTIVEKDLPLGFHRVEFDGSRFASSVYFYRLIAEGLDDNANDRYVQTRKMILLR